MSEPIKVGDLVAITRTCCEPFTRGHYIFTVSMFTDIAIRLGAQCRFCRKTLPKERWAFPEGGDCAFPLSWLKKIDPPSELEIEKRDEEITA